MARNSDSVKRARRSFDFLFIKNKSAPIRQENELTLHLSKTELFDRVILLPHAELNAAVYHAVNQFTAKYTGSRMKLTIFCDPVSESLQNTFGRYTPRTTGMNTGKNRPRHGSGDRVQVRSEKGTQNKGIRPPPAAFCVSAAQEKDRPGLADPLAISRE